MRKNIVLLPLLVLFWVLPASMGCQKQTGRRKMLADHVVHLMLLLLLLQCCRVAAAAAAVAAAVAHIAAAFFA